MKEVTFGSLPVGAIFRERPDGLGYAFKFDLVKIKPEMAGGDRDGYTVNARCGKVSFYFADNEMVGIQEKRRWEHE